MVDKEQQWRRWGATNNHGMYNDKKTEDQLLREMLVGFYRELEVVVVRTRR